MIGKVQKYDEVKGYGFLAVSFHERYFFHFSNWNGAEAPVIGEAVEFGLGPGYKPGQREQAIRIVSAEGVSR